MIEHFEAAGKNADPAFSVANWPNFANALRMELKTVYSGEKEYTELNDQLVAFNRQHVNWDGKTFQIVLASKKGTLLGGARGMVRMGSVEVRGLWLDEDLRGSGHGLKIIQRLEEVARSNGARSALLDTYDFQARNFYQKLGYEVFGVFPYPDGTERYYMRKTL